jgi:hypothetical protein
MVKEVPLHDNLSVQLDNFDSAIFLVDLEALQIHSTLRNDVVTGILTVTDILEHYHSIFTPYHSDEQVYIASSFNSQLGSILIDPSNCRLSWSECGERGTHLAYVSRRPAV